MSNFNLRPIAPEIQDKLNEKSRLLRKENPNQANTPIGDSTELLNKLYTRTTWAQMVSLNIVAPTPAEGEPVEWEKGHIAIIGSGGEVSEKVHTQPGPFEPLMRAGFSETYAGTDTNTDGKGEKIETLFYQPPSGIRSINATYAGNVKSLRKVRVEFTVFSLDDLQRLSPHFFRVGAEVLVEFGWSTNTHPTIGDKIIRSYKQFGVAGLQRDPEMFILNKTNLANEYEKQVLGGEGDYDFAVGVVSNFDYSLRDDGGFNATITVMTTGVSIIDASLPKSTMGKPETFTIEIPGVGNEEDKTIDVPADNFYDAIKNFPETLFYSLTGRRVLGGQKTYTIYKKDGTIVSPTDTLIANTTIFEEYSENNVIQIFSALNWNSSADFYKKMKNNFSANNFQKFSEEVVGTATDVGEEGKVTRAESEESWYNKMGFDWNPTFLDYAHSEPMAWVRWGWFEDNILTRFTGYVGDLNSPTVYFHSVEPKLAPNGRIADKDGERGFESSKFIMPKPLLTTDVTSIIIPDKISGLSLCDPLEVTDTDKELTFNMYANLGRYIDAKVSADTDGDTSSEPHIAKVQAKDSANTEIESGYIRNLFFSAKAIQDAFLGVTNLREGLDNIFALIRENFGSSNSFEVVSDIFHPSRLGIIDKNLVSDLSIFGKQDRAAVNKQKGNLNKVYEFPAFEPGSMVKTQDLKVTIPNSMAVTALYGGNQPDNKISEYDPSKGGVEAQKLTKFLKIDGFENFQRIMNLNKTNYNILPITEKSTSFGKYAGNGTIEMEAPEFENTQNMFLDSFNRSLRLSAKYDETTYTGFTSTSPLPVSSGSTYRLGIDLNDTNAAWAANKYNAITGKMKTIPINFKNEILYRIEYDPFKSVPNRFSLYNGLMELSLTIDGIGGIFPGDAFITKYLPKGFKKQVNKQYPVLFQAMEITQDLSADTWSTTIKGMPRMNAEAFPKRRVLKTENEYPYTLTPKLLPMETGILRHLNFFHMRSDFVKVAYEYIQGINSTVMRSPNLTTWNGHPDKIFGDFMSRMRYVDYSSVKGGNALMADFSKSFDELVSMGGIDIPGKEKIWAKVTKAPQPIQRIGNPLNALFYFQLLLMYVGQWMAAVGDFTKTDANKKLFYRRVLSDTWFKDNRPEILKKDGLSIRTSKAVIVRDQGTNYDTHTQYFKRSPTITNDPWNVYYKNEDISKQEAPEGYKWMAWDEKPRSSEVAPWMVILENELGLKAGTAWSGAESQLGALKTKLTNIVKKGKLVGEEKGLENDIARIAPFVTGGKNIFEFDGDLVTIKEFNPVSILDNVMQTELLIKAQKID